MTENQKKNKSIQRCQYLQDPPEYQFNTNSNQGQRVKDVKVRDMDTQLWQKFKAQAVLLDIPLKIHVMHALERHLKDCGTMAGTTEPRKHKAKKIDANW